MAKRRKRRKTSNQLPVPVWLGGVLGLALIAAGLITLTARQSSNPNTFPYPNITRLSPAEAYNQQQAGMGVIIDVRDTPFYEEARAAGAISVPEDDLLAYIDELPTDKNLILY